MGTLDANIHCLLHSTKKSSTFAPHMVIKEYLPYYRRNLKVALPVMVTQAGQVMVQLADNIMVGHIGAAELAGVSFANAVFMIGMVAAIGFAQGSTPIIGQCFGRGDSDHVSKTFANSTLLNLLTGIALSTILFCVGFMLDFMGQNPEVLMYAKQYYFICLASMLPLTLFFNIRCFSEGIGNTKNAMYITIASNLINIFLNWVLIFGKLGAPRLGVAGAAYSTLIARLLSFIIFSILLFTVDEYRQYVKRIRKSFIDWLHIKELLKTSLPIATQSLLEVTAFSFSAIMVGWMGKYELAAHQIAQSLSHLSFMVATGIGAAATIRVSHQYGAGKYYEMYMAGKAAVHMAVFLMTLFGAVYICFYRSIPWLYTNDPHVVPIAENLIIVMSLFQIWDAMQMSSMSALRGMKDINRPLLFSAISYYGVCLPCGYLLGFTLKLGPIGVWIGLLLGLAFAGILFHTRFKKLCTKLFSYQGT